MWTSPPMYSRIAVPYGSGGGECNLGGNKNDDRRSLTPKKDDPIVDDAGIELIKTTADHTDKMRYLFVLNSQTGYDSPSLRSTKSNNFIPGYGQHVAQGVNHYRACLHLPFQAAFLDVFPGRLIIFKYLHGFEFFNLNSVTKRGSRFSYLSYMESI